MSTILDLLIFLMSYRKTLHPMADCLV